MAANAERTQRVPVLGIDAAIRFATPADRAAFADELAAAVASLAAKYHDDEAVDGRWQRVTVGVHPVPAGIDPGAPTEPAAPKRPAAEEDPR